MENPASHYWYEENFAKQLSACVHGATMSCDGAGISFSERIPEKIFNVVVKVLKRALKTQRFLLIVAEDAESETLAILSLN